MNCTVLRRFFSWVPLLVLLLHTGSSAQVIPERLTITFEETSIDSNTVVLDRKAGFPSPVLSLITIQNNRGGYVHDLASRTAWLHAGDTAACGLPMDAVWTLIHEYHQADTTIPDLPDVKALPMVNGQYPWEIREVYDVAGYGLSVALAMDYSGSLGDDIYKSEDAARIFVRQMSASDAAALIKFTGKVSVFQEFTSDTLQLMDAISRPTEDRQYTAVYDAAYTAVEMMKQRVAQGRQAVVVYTDGKDNYSSHSASDVIALAQSVQDTIPVYMIGVGNSLDADELERIALETKGAFWQATTVDSLAAIYATIFEKIRGYYVLLHRTPDPYYNDSMRLVDINVNIARDAVDTTAWYGRGKGHYTVPGKPADFAFIKEAVTDSSTTSDTGETVWIVRDGGQIDYTLSFTNHGPSASAGHQVYDVPPQGLDLISASPPVSETRGDTLLWVFGHTDPNTTQQIQLTFAPLDLPTEGASVLSNKAWVHALADSNQSNDTAYVEVTYLPPTPVDLHVEKVVSSASTDAQGRPTAGAGDLISYTVRVENRGETDAVNIDFYDVLPSLLTWQSGPTPSAYMSSDTLRWTLDVLAAHGAEQSFVYTAKVSDHLPPQWILQANHVYADTPDEGLPEDNSASDTLWVQGSIPPKPEVRVDPVRIEPQDSVAIEVMTRFPTDSWDMVLTYESPAWQPVMDYGDDFIDMHSHLTPEAWTRMTPRYFAAEMSVDNQLEETVEVTFYTRYTFTNVDPPYVHLDTASTVFYISSTDDFYLDHNRWQPDDGPLGLEFQLSTNRPAELIIYDVSGAFIRRVFDGAAVAGWNFTTWDGLDEENRPVGSGIYIAILRSGGFQKYRKFILTR